VNIDIAIVGQFRGEDRRDAAEQRAAGIGRKFPIGDLARLGGGGERLAAQEAARVIEPALREAKRCSIASPSNQWL
jgi:hypothetical protein